MALEKLKLHLAALLFLLPTLSAWGETITDIKIEGLRRTKPAVMQEMLEKFKGTDSASFDRKKLEDVLKEVEKLYPPKADEPAKSAPSSMDPEHKAEISIDDFGKMELRVGVIKSCEAVAKSKKLLCSQVDVGDRTIQIVSGIRKYYSPEEMVGKKVMAIVNLAPAKLAGVESQGMLLCAEDAEGNLALMTPEKDMPAGAEIC